MSENERLRKAFWEVYRDKDKAIEILNRIELSDETALDDYYFVGELLVEFEEYHRAIEIFTLCIAIEEKENSKWYHDCNYLLRAYSYMKTGDYIRANADILSIIDMKIEIRWLYQHPEAKIDIPLINEKLNVNTATYC